MKKEDHSFRRMATEHEPSGKRKQNGVQAREGRIPFHINRKQTVYIKPEDKEKFEALYPQ